MPGPTGTVTIVFTDIQGSTELWERLGNDFREALDIHNRLMREALRAHDGYEVKTEGDAFMVAFAEASAAVKFAAEVQQRLHQANWPAALGESNHAATSSDGAFKGLRVRIGMHTGDPIVEQLGDAVDYFGPVVNRAARVAGAAHGGQVLISGSTYDIAGEIAGCGYRDLGEHRLKGLDQLEHIRQVLPESLAAREFPPITTITKSLTNLPAQLTSFIGREEQIAALVDQLAKPGTRLVTLLAPGGTGKTRLSMRVGEELLESYEGGVWFADLTEARDGTAVAQAVARALGVPLTTREDPIATVGRLLQMRKAMLLILDNFEQVVDAASDTVARWLRESTQLTCLATSRFLLGVAGEREFALPPLSAPPRMDGTRHSTEKILSRLSGYDSVRLFVERAVQVQPTFTLSRETGDAVAGICATLEGLPLAIELAAARVRVMKPAKILQNLGKRFELLKSSRRDLTDRQRTLEGAIQWSFELLDETERSVLHQCVAFRGGLFLDAAEEVLDAGDGFAMDLVQALRDKSFLRSYEQGDELRFGMLESVREFLQRKQCLDESTRERHAEYYARHAAERRAALETPQAATALEWLGVEAQNLEAALESRPGETGLALAYNDLLRTRGPFARRVPLLEGVLKHADAANHSTLRNALSRAFQDLGRIDDSEHAAAEALRLAGDDAAKVQAMCRTATVKLIRGLRDESLELLNQAEQLATEVTLRAFVMTCRGPVLRRMGLNEGAERDFQQALEIERARGNGSGVAFNTLNLGNLYRATGRPDEALECYRQAEEALTELGNRSAAAQAAGNIGIVYLEREQIDQAIDHFTRAELLERELGNPGGIGVNLGNRGIALQRLNRDEEALECYREAEGVLRKAGAVVAATTHALNAAALLSALGRYSESLQVAEGVRQDFENLHMRNSPGWVIAMETLATAEAGLGRKDRSRIIARELIEASEQAPSKDERVTRAIKRVRELDS